MQKGNRSYMVWRYGKPPDLVVEIVSNREGSELEKGQRYAEMGVGYYVVFDPERWLGDRVLRAYIRHGSAYMDLLDPTWIEELGLGLKTWQGHFEDMEALWLRPCDREGRLLPTVAETARQAQAETRQAQAEARQAQAEAQQAQAEAERLRARLRELGLEAP